MHCPCIKYGATSFFNARWGPLCQNPSYKPMTPIIFFESKFSKKISVDQLVDRYHMRVFLHFYPPKKIKCEGSSSRVSNAMVAILLVWIIICTLMITYDFRAEDQFGFWKGGTHHALKKKGVAPCYKIRASKYNAFFWFNTFFVLI